MTELAILEQRRELVQLSARLQRATLAHRLDAIQAHPARTVLDLAIAALHRTDVQRTAVMTALVAWRFMRRRRRSR